jgi:putative DNA methylase
MTKDCKRLIEVDLPIRRISEYSRWEKKSVPGHLKQMHLWWARRPLAACRAVMCAALWPDPADKNCPATFRSVVRREMLLWVSHERQQLLSPESHERFEKIRQKPSLLDDGKQLRGALLDFIGDFSRWESGALPEFLNTTRALTQAAHVALGGMPGTRPLVVDPFAGGGSIPVEAVRIGCDAFASDINPVAVLLNKVALEYIPKFGNRLSEEVRRWGRWIQTEAHRELAMFYPQDPDGGTPIAYLWARTIQCEGPGCGAEVPLIRSFWLTKKSTRAAGFRFVVDQGRKRVDFELVDNPSASDLGQPTVRRGSATCPVCGFTTPVASVRRQLKPKKGGANAARLFCVVRTFPDKQGRYYRLAIEDDLKIVARATQQLASTKSKHTDSLPLIPAEPTPQGGGSGAGRAFSQRNYGMDVFEDLFTARQALALSTFVKFINAAPQHFADVTDNSLKIGVQTVLSLNLTKLVDLATSLGAWEPNIPTVQHLFGRQAIGMCWDFAEGVPIGEGRGSWINYLEKMADILERQVGLLPGHAEQQDASKLSLPDDSAQVFFTDPPYYDAVPYADLSDLFYVWLKRALRGQHEDLFRTELTPKAEECIVDEVKGKDAAYFERTMREVMTHGRRIVQPSGIGVLVFAHKSTAGWEAQLQAMIDAGWIITGSWPIDTENASRLRAQSSAALASSIHIICRPREKPDGSVRADEVGDWRDVLGELPVRIRSWMQRLINEGVVGADAIFACLGPALEIFSRYSRVEKADGEQVFLGEFLEHVWATVSREALATIFEGADASGLEADARLTAMWLWTLNAGNTDATNGESAEDDDTDESEGGTKKVKATGFVLEYDAARKIAQGLGANLEVLTSLVEISGDKARLLPVAERAHHLFGKDEGKVSPARRKRTPQLDLFKVLEQADEGGTTFGETRVESHGATVLDRIHQSMILFAAGRSEAMKRFLVEDGAGRDQRFWRLAQALSALYPSHTEEKRWVDGVLARKKGLGF